MAIRVDQALCGEQNKAWELLKSTLEDNALAKKIAFQTDLQDSPPSGLTWLPVTRGFSFGDHFLLIRTYPDKSPEVRNGRVFSHCLIIDKKDLNRLDDITPLLAMFSPAIDKNIELNQIIIEPDKGNPIELTGQLALRFNKVIQSFMAFINQSAAIVWVGQKDFDLAISRVWQLLPDQRQDLHFGINFNAGEVVKDKLSFVSIPENLEGKFSNKGFTIIGQEDSVILKEFAEQFLAGEVGATARVQKFVSAIEASKPTAKEVRTLAKGVPTFENLEKESDLKLLNTLSNIIAKYSPDPHQGQAIKTKVIDQISLAIESAESSDIFLLRNFEVKSFEGSQDKISKSVTKWCDRFLLNPKENRKLDFTEFIRQIFGAGTSNWLINLVRERIAEFLSSLSESVCKVIWVWINNDPNTLKLISGQIERSRSAETLLSGVVTTVEGSVLDALRNFAIERDWLRLNATVLKLQYDFRSAIREHLKVDRDDNSFDGIEIISAGVAGNEVIELAVENGEERLIRISGSICKKANKFIKTLNFENRNSQAIWLSAIENGNNVFDGVSHPQETVFKLFDILINRGQVNELLLEKIADTDSASALYYPNRNKLWSVFPFRVRDKFLAKSAAELLESLSKNHAFPIPDDSELSNYVVKNAISVFLYYNSQNIKTVLPIFGAYNVPEQIVRDYVTNFQGKLDVVSATQLGQLVTRRGYRRVAALIFQRANAGNAYRFALAECYDLLDFIDKGIAHLSGLVKKMDISYDDWWDAFIQLSYSLYASGPTENGIWMQAEGKEFDLLAKGTGKQIWIAALEKLRKKKCSGKISVKKLLNAMLDENKKNFELKTLKKLWEEM